MNTVRTLAVTVDPDSRPPGSYADVATVVLDEVDIGDQHLVIGRGRHVHAWTVLNDNGDEPDAVDDDFGYAGYLRLRRLDGGQLERFPGA